MAAFKNILRSFVVMGIILGAGLLGLWFLNGDQNKIKNQNPAASSNSQIGDGGEADRFSDIGGKTPQETIKFLIGALEKNNLMLAVEYFSLENREAESQDLAELYNVHLLGDLIKDLKNLKNGKAASDNHYIFEVPDESGGAAAEIELIKNEKGVWKILSM
ncbi:hypothetical protein HY838_01745 [Candidatus Azambacteria bacterium]|nr:hypothetical protein [Candidatus Azambacteria bacterium]